MKYLKFFLEVNSTEVNAIKYRRYYLHFKPTIYSYANLQV